MFNKQQPSVDNDQEMENIQSFIKFENCIKIYMSYQKNAAPK